MPITQDGHIRTLVGRTFALTCCGRVEIAASECCGSDDIKIAAPNVQLCVDGDQIIEVK